MRRGRTPTPVVLTDDERQALTSLAHRSRTAPQRARRARVILACADGQPTTGIARRLHLSPTTVCKWRTRFLADRIDGLTDEPRPGAPRRITDTQVEDVVVRTLESTPPGATHWSTRGMAKATGLSHTTQPGCRRSETGTSCRLATGQIEPGSTPRRSGSAVSLSSFLRSRFCRMNPMRCRLAASIDSATIRAKPSAP